jgi:Tol biopolymer transport system component
VTAASSEQASGRCDEASPILAVDSDTTDTDGLLQVYVVTADRGVDRITGDWVASQASFAPDGDRIVVVRADGDYESAGPNSTSLWAMGSDGSDPRALTEGDVLDGDPDWSPDGSSILFTHTVLNGGVFTSSIATVPAEGGEPTELSSIAADNIQEPVWSPDGQRIAFVRVVYASGSHLTETTVWTMAADGGDARPLATMPYVESLDWRPEGTSLLVDRGGSEEGAYLLDIASGEAELAGSGADLTAWSPDGASVYYFEDGGPPEVPEGRLRVGHIEEGKLVADRDMPTGDTELNPSFSLAVGPCG